MGQTETAWACAGYLLRSDGYHWRAMAGTDRRNNCRPQVRRLPLYGEMGAVSAMTLLVLAAWAGVMP
jgi:hypothetical protein